MVLAALIISLIRGTPSVTFIEATPAKWKVLSVICVPGSPIDCAPIAPTAVPFEEERRSAGAEECTKKARKGAPGSTLDLTYLVQHSCRNSSICFRVTLVLLLTIASWCSAGARRESVSS